MTPWLAAQGALVDKLWAVVEKPEKARNRNGCGRRRRWRSMTPTVRGGRKVQEPVVERSGGVPAVYLAAWMEAFRPVRDKLLAPLAAVYRDSERRDDGALPGDGHSGRLRRRPAAILADLLMDADEKQFAVHLSEVQGAGGAWPARADRRDRPETAARMRRTKPRRSWRSGRRMRRWPCSG